MPLYALLLYNGTTSCWNGGARREQNGPIVRDADDVRFDSSAVVRRVTRYEK